METTKSSFPSDEDLRVVFMWFIDEEPGLVVALCSASWSDDLWIEEFPRNDEQ